MPEVNAQSQESQESQVTEVLKGVIEHARDLTVRDGIQSWDANKWRFEDVSTVLKEIDQLAVIAKKHDIAMNPVETWGGGQVAQPAKFLHENPLNLSLIHI